MGSVSFVRTPEEQQKLIEAAKKEGKLILYTAGHIPTIERLIRSFNSKYPWIAVEYSKTSSDKVGERFSAEQSAGLPSADIISAPYSPNFDNFKAKGWLQPYLSPEGGNIPRDPDFTFYHHFASFACVFVYNTKFVSDDEAIKSWKDILNPKWKGKIGGAMCPARGITERRRYYTLRSILGVDGMKELAKMNWRSYEPFDPSVMAVVSGELWVSINSSAELYPPARDGAPIKMTMPKEGVVPQLITQAIGKLCPNPNAARLWMDFTISKEMGIFYAKEFSFPLSISAIPEGFDKFVSWPKNVKRYSDIPLFRFDEQEVWAMTDKLTEEYEQIFSQQRT